MGPSRSSAALIPCRMASATVLILHHAAGLLDGVRPGIATISATGWLAIFTRCPAWRASRSVIPTVANGGVMNRVRGTTTRSVVERRPSPVSWFEDDTAVVERETGGELRFALDVSTS